MPNTAFTVTDASVVLREAVLLQTLLHCVILHKQTHKTSNAMRTEFALKRDE